MGRTALVVAGFLAAACTLIAWCCLYVGAQADRHIEEM